MHFLPDSWESPGKPQALSKDAISTVQQVSNKAYAICKEVESEMYLFIGAESNPRPLTCFVLFCFVLFYSP
jgi:hypothetical protein